MPNNVTRTSKVPWFHQDWHCATFGAKRLQDIGRLLGKEELRLISQDPPRKLEIGVYPLELAMEVCFGNIGHIACALGRTQPSQLSHCNIHNAQEGTTSPKHASASKTMSFKTPRQPQPNPPTTRQKYSTMHSNTSAKRQIILTNVKVFRNTKIAKSVLLRTWFVATPICQISNVCDVTFWF